MSTDASSDFLRQAELSRQELDLLYPPVNLPTPILVNAMPIIEPNATRSPVKMKIGKRRIETPPAKSIRTMDELTAEVVKGKSVNLADLQLLRATK